MAKKKKNNNTVPTPASRKGMPKESKHFATSLLDQCFVPLMTALAMVVGYLCLDFLLFSVLQLANHQSSHGQENIQEALATPSDVYIFGDSRAKHHLDPSIIGTAIGASAFNASSSGYDILYYRCLADIIEQRHIPKLYLVNISLPDFHRNPEQYGSMSVFAPYIDESPVIKDMLTWQQWRSQITMKGLGSDIEDAMLDKPEWSLTKKYIWKPILRYHISRSVRFNAKLWPLVEDAFGVAHEGNLGFVPLQRAFEQENEDWILEKDIDYSMVDQFVKFVRQSKQKGIRVVAVIGPSYRNATGWQLRPDEWYYLFAIRQILQAADIPAIEISENNHPFYKEAAHWVDRDHFNAEGAEFYSRHVALHLQRLLSLPDWKNTPYQPTIGKEQWVLPEALFTR